MNRIDQRTTIYAPVHMVFDFVRDPHNLVTLSPNLSAVWDIQKAANGGRNFYWQYKLAGVRFEGSCECSDCAVNQFIVNHTQGSITSTMKWLFEPEDGETHVTLALEYVTPAPLLRKHTEAEIFHDLDQAAVVTLKNLKSVLELMLSKTPNEQV